jgi:hypothetical protein
MFAVLPLLSAHAVAESEASPSDFDSSELTKLWNMAVNAPCKIADENHRWPAELQSFVASSFQWKQCISRSTPEWPIPGSSLTDPGIEPDYPNRDIPPYVLRSTLKVNPYRSNVFAPALMLDKYHLEAMKLQFEFEQRKAKREMERLDAEVKSMESANQKPNLAKKEELERKRTQLEEKCKQLEALQRGRANNPVGEVLTNFVWAYEDLKREYFKVKKYDELLRQKPYLNTAAQENQNLRGSNSKQTVQQMYLAAFNHARVRFEESAGKEATNELLQDLEKAQTP